MKIPFTVGTVGHFGLAVKSPKKSAKWFKKTLGFQKQFEFEEGIAIGNRNVTIALHKGKPRPKTLGHMSFHLANLAALKKALVHLKKQKVKIEDPGEESGPEAPGSKNLCVWFHDPDGYRWELNVQHAKR